MSEINKFKELLHHHTQVSFACGEHRVPREYAEFEARQRETERALVEWIEKREARIAELEAALDAQGGSQNRGEAEGAATAFRDAAFAYLNVCDTGKACSDRSCLRCRIADAAFEVEQKHGIRPQMFSRNIPKEPKLPESFEVSPGRVNRGGCYYSQAGRCVRPLMEGQG